MLDYFCTLRLDYFNCGLWIRIKDPAHVGQLLYALPGFFIVDYGSWIVDQDQGSGSFCMLPLDNGFWIMHCGSVSRIWLMLKAMVNSEHIDYDDFD